MLCDEVEQGSIQLVNIVDGPQFPYDLTYVRKLHRNENGQGHDEFTVEGHYGGPTLSVFFKNGYSSND